MNLPLGVFQSYLATGHQLVGNNHSTPCRATGGFLLNTAVESPIAPIVVSVNWRSGEVVRLQRTPLAAWRDESLPMSRSDAHLPTFECRSPQVSVAAAETGV